MVYKLTDSQIEDYENWVLGITMGDRLNDTQLKELREVIEQNTAFTEISFMLGVMRDHILNALRELQDRRKLEAQVPDDDFKLCYVEGDTAYFTTQPLDKQWGDDWNDAPYEHNAGTPYAWSEREDKPRWYIHTLKFTGFESPADIAMSNSHYSVEMINNGCVAWLTSSRKPVVNIYAGSTIGAFKRKILEGQGAVYEEV